MMYPKNKIIKHVMSSLWGSLSKSNNLIKTWDEIQSEGLNIGIDDDCDYKIIDYIQTNEKEIYKLRSMDSPYKYNFRLKSFLTSYGRFKISIVVMEDVDSLIRVQTDGVVFNKKMDLKYERLIPEAKTTGLIKWSHVNKYDKILDLL